MDTMLNRKIANPYEIPAKGGSTEIILGEIIPPEPIKMDIRPAPFPCPVR